MKITRLKPSPRKPGFVAVFVDGARFAILPVEGVLALGLKEGVSLDESQRADLETAAERAKAYDAAVRLLAVRARSVRETMARLRKKGLRPDAVDHAVGRLEGEGLLDDATMAREYARSRADRGYGRVRILADLSRRGVGRHEAERAVAEAGGDDDEARRERVLALARKRAARLGGLDRTTARRRLTAFLARRGFEAGDIWKAVNDLLPRDHGIGG
jgi:regulatory protein